MGLSTGTVCNTRAQTVKFWGSLNDLLTVTILQHLYKLGTVHVHSEV